MDRDMMDGMLPKVLGATMIGAGLWMLLRDSDEEMEMMNAVGEEASASRGRMNAFTERAGEWRGRAVDKTRAATTRVDTYVGASPFVAGIVALAVGAVAGMLIPETQKEHELLGDYRDRVAEKARQAARDAMDRGRDMVGNAVHTATETIKEQAMGGSRDDREAGFRRDAEV